MVGACLIPFCAQAQTFGVAFESARGSRDSDLGTVNGVRADFTRPLSRYGLFRLGAHHLTRGGESFGSPCSGGPLPPGTCGPESLDETRRLTYGSIGVGLTSPTRHPVSVAVHVDALLGEAYTDDRGRTTGTRRTGYVILHAAAIGTDLHYRFPRTSVLRRAMVTVGASAAGANPLALQCSDCFMPFNAPFGFTTWHAGVAIGRAVR